MAGLRQQLRELQQRYDALLEAAEALQNRYDDLEARYGELRAAYEGLLELEPDAPDWHYDYAESVPTLQLREELGAILPPERWVPHDPGPATIGGLAPSGMVAGLVPATDAICRYLCQKIAARGKAALGANCEFFASACWTEMRWFCNARGGGRLAVGPVNGNPVGFHPWSETAGHRLMLARLDTGDWRFYDVAYAGSPDPERWIYGISDADSGFNNLKM